jgi:heme exporter protein C
MRDEIYLAGTFIVNIIALYMIFIYSPTLVVGAEVTADPEVFRIFYLHLPAAIVAYTAFAITFVGSILYLLKKDFKWDTMAAASAKLGLIFCGATIFLGSIWAENAWGSYWNWDPRETTTLILFFAYVAYLAYRIAIEDREKKARLSSVLGVLAFATVPLSYMSIQIWQTLHPIVISLGKVELSPPVIYTFIVSLIGELLIFFFMLNLTVKAENLTEKIEKIKAGGGS